MSVVIETTLGDITVDLFLSERPRACLNFLKLCKIKYYNFNLFHTISRGFIAQTGDPTASRNGGESIYGVLDGAWKRFFEGENEPRIKHTKMGLISFVGNEKRMISSQFFLTLGDDLSYLDEKHCVFGEVVEGFEVLEMINEVICDTDDRPYQDVRITHTVILDDPYPDPKRLVVPSRSPSPSAERLQGGRIGPDEDIDELEGKPPEVVAEIQAEKEAKARATILEMVGDLPDADMAPPENVLFVCKLNPVTNDDDLEIIFSRFGIIKSCEVIRDKKTGDSLQYAFVEFQDQKSCENAYFKMDNVLIDDRRIHVDFSQSVSKIKWHGKGRGVTHYDDKGKKSKYTNNDIGKGNYKIRRHDKQYRKEDSRGRSPKQIRDMSKSPRRQDNPRRVKDNSTSPSRDRNRRYKQDNNKDSISSERRVTSGTVENYRNWEKNEYKSMKDNYRSKSRKDSRSPTPRKNTYISKPPRRSRDKSRSPNNKSRIGREKSSRDKSRSPNNKSRIGREKSTNTNKSPGEQREPRHYMESVRKHKDMFKSSKPDSNRKNNYDNETAKYSKIAPSSSKYSHDRNDSRSKSSVAKDTSKVKLNMSAQGSKIDRKEKNKKKKQRYSSEDSDSDDDKKAKKRKDSSDSSDSDDYQKKSSKRREISNSDSEDYKKSKSKKKKKKKHDSDSE